MTCGILLLPVLAGYRRAFVDWLSLLLVVFIAVLVVRAWRNGIVREFVALGALIIAVPIASTFYGDLVPKVEPIVDNLKLANLVAFLAIVFGVVIVGQLLSSMLSRIVQVLQLGSLDHSVGAIFGFLQGCLLIQVVLLVFISYPQPDLRTHIDSSLVATWLVDYSSLTRALLPGVFDSAIDIYRSTFSQLASEIT